MAPSTSGSSTSCTSRNRAGGMQTSLSGALQDLRRRGHDARLLGAGEGDQIAERVREQVGERELFARAYGHRSAPPSHDGPDGRFGCLTPGAGLQSKAAARLYFYSGFEYTTEVGDRATDERTRRRRPALPSLATIAARGQARAARSRARTARRAWRARSAAPAARRCAPASPPCRSSTAARPIICFASFRSEIDTAPFISWCLERGIAVALPRIVGPHHLEAFAVSDPAARPGARPPGASPSREPACRSSSRPRSTSSSCPARRSIAGAAHGLRRRLLRHLPGAPAPRRLPDRHRLRPADRRSRAV